MCEWKTENGVCMLNSENGYIEYCHEGPCTQDTDMNPKSLFISIVKKDIYRPGVEELMKYLENTDFYTAPASTKHHGAKEGGLLEHSLQVYKNLKKLADFYFERGDIEYISRQSIAITALFHDVCKIYCYKKDENTQEYFYDERLKFGGHGSKSVYLLQQYIELDCDEAAAINCHMGAFENKHVGEVYEKYSLAWLLHVADEEAAYIQKV